MMYPRLRLARNLLKDDGVIFMSIDDNEVDNLKKMCNEIFGEANFVAINLMAEKIFMQMMLSIFQDVMNHILFMQKKIIE